MVKVPLLHPDLGTAPSTIAGTGLHATAPIAAGTPVARLAAGARPAAGLLASGIGFGNHSCEPNLWWSGAYTLVARRDIRTGEEVTSDYATSTGAVDYLLRCHCETYRCRGLIAGDDWQIPQLQRTYAGHWAPELQRLISASASTR